MVHKGEIVVAWDPDLRDMYVCEVVAGDEETRRNLLCRIISMLAYPIQHAVLDGSIPNENPPLMPGTVARLKYVRREVISGALQTWEHTFDKCLNEYRSRRAFLYGEGRRIPESCRTFQMPDAAEFDILARHARGEFKGRRAVCAQ